MLLFLAIIKIQVSNIRQLAIYCIDIQTKYPSLDATPGAISFTFRRMWFAGLLLH